MEVTAKFLRDQRIKRGENKTQFAKRLGLNRTQYTQYEAGEPVSELVAARILNALNEASMVMDDPDGSIGKYITRKGQAGRSVASNFRTQVRGLFNPIIDTLPEAVYEMFEVEGSSMENTIKQGDWLLCRLETVDTMIERRVYVLVIEDPKLQAYRPSGIWIKRCMHRKKNGYISCMSDNKDTADPFTTFIVKTDQVKEVWYPVRRITANMDDPNRDLYDRLDELEGRVEMLESVME